ncbi:MAG: hypothetical protein HWN65_01190 [Candidatus Helarchaeota archaeon]|nr:hypothetical protein [Candidatus Helarchaeota archaeon]
MARKAPPAHERTGKGPQPQQKPPPPPSEKKVKPPPRKPVKERKLPPIKKKGRGKIWAGIIFIIIGIVILVALWGQSFLPFIGIIFILLAVYLIYKGLTDVDKVLVPLKITRAGKTRTKMVYKPKKTLNKGVILLLVVFIFFALPIFLTLFQFGNVTDQPYSIFNEGDGGCSTFREDIETKGYETSAIISSYAELRKFPEDYPLNRTVLFLIGPKAIFFPTGLIAIQQLLDSGGRLVILQDMGTANEGLLFLGLWEVIGSLFGGTVDMSPLDIPFQDGFLCEGAGGNESCAAFTATLNLMGSDRNVRFWTASPLGASPSFTIIESAPGTVWLDLNKNFQQDPEDVSGSYGLIAASGAGNIVVISDPDILTNKLMTEPAYDNQLFASDLVDAITGSDTTWKIVFDEAHQVKTGYSSAFYFGMIIAVEDFLLLSWFFAPLGPYLAFRITKKFIPKAEKPMKVKLSQVKREGESLYAKRLNWFKRRRRYEKALALLYRRLRRSLEKTLDLKGFDVDEAVIRILGNYPEVDEKRLRKAFETFREVEKGRRVIYEQEFLKIFLEMRWISDLAAPKEHF